MKLPSLSFITQQAAVTFRRFPLALINAAVGTIAAVLLINHEGYHPDSILTNIMMTTALGISFLTTIVVVGEKRKWSSGTTLAAQLVGVVVLVGYVFTLPRNIDGAPYIHLIRFAILFVGMHLLTAAAPFAGKNEPNGFWQYNKELFLRILTAFLFSGVLWIGLAVALQAMHHLFDINISEKRYAELWVVIIGIFNTWFFLAGVADDLDKLNLETAYPRGLKILTQYILLPLVVIYLLILYAYMGKILFEQSLPKGWVSTLILSFSIAGILALLLVHPIKDWVENVWIRTVSKWYYVVLIPLDIMLLIAIWQRTSDYGITVNRYIVIVLAFWLTAITLYFVISKTKNIKVIPTTLCIIAFCSAFGPWGAFDVSLNSQLDRLQPLLVKNGILVDEKIRKTTRQVQFEDKKEISSIIRYLVETHGTVSIQPWFETQLDTMGTGAYGSGTNIRHQQPQLVVAMMGIDYVTQWQSSISGQYDYSSDRKRAIDIEGYLKLVRLTSYNQIDSLKITLRENVSCLVHSDAGGLSVRILCTGDIEDSLRIDLQPMMNRLSEKYGNVMYQSNIPSEVMTMNSEGIMLKATIVVHHIRHQKDSTSTYGNALEADVLIGLKE